MLDENWQEAAACRGMDADLFFPERGELVLAARRFCRSCPVIEDCLTSALSQREIGIWGGTSERERRTMKRRIRLVESA